jgi:pimeloyl-ACP methyl ester carboxylesterase
MSGESVVLLHPATADARAWDPNLPAFAEHFRVLVPERDRELPASFEGDVDATIALIESEVGGPAHVVGCSDGATLALLVGVRRPDLMLRVIAAGGVAHHTGWLPGVIPPDDALHQREPALTDDDLARITGRALIMVGDDDEVALEHAIAVYRALPDGELAVVPGTSHGLLVEKPELCNAMMVDFLLSDPVPTFAPIRRKEEDRR